MNELLSNFRLINEIILPWLQLAAIALIAREVRKNGKK